jgi:hypothetical protein
MAFLLLHSLAKATVGDQMNAKKTNFGLTIGFLIFERGDRDDGVGSTESVAQIAEWPFQPSELRRGLPPR